MSASMWGTHPDRLGSFPSLPSGSLSALGLASAAAITSSAIDAPGKISPAAEQWPSPDRDITYRETDMARLVECEFLEWERGIGSGSLITLRFGGCTNDIVAGYRETLAAATKA
jgi:hypothetical protein